MSAVADAITQVRSALDTAASQFMASSCSIISISNTADDYGGATHSETPIASNVPCDYETLKVPLTRVVDGRTITGLDHKITLPSNSNTWAILPSQKIVVAANGDVPQLVFNDPVVEPDSLGPFVEVVASLAVQ